MKKPSISLFLSIFLFQFQSTYAQFSLGLNAGIGVTTYEDLQGAGATAGLALEYDLTERISLHTGLNLSSQFVGGLLGVDYEGDMWDLNQYFIPLTCKFKTAPKKVQPYFNLGTSIGMLTKTEYKIEGGFEGPPVSFRDYQHDLILGAGLNINLKNVTIYFEIQDRYNLNDLTDRDDEHHLHVNTLEFLHVGVLFPFKLHGKPGI